MSNNGEIMNDEYGTCNVPCNGTQGSPCPVQNCNSTVTITVLGINQQLKISSLILVCFIHPVAHRPFAHILSQK
jgi:hypothetical protein